MIGSYYTVFLDEMKDVAKEWPIQFGAIQLNQLLAFSSAASAPSAVSIQDDQKPQSDVWSACTTPAMHYAGLPITANTSITANEALAT